jgi:hypothetical protein
MEGTLDAARGVCVVIQVRATAGPPDEAMLEQPLHGHG